MVSDIQLDIMRWCQWLRRHKYDVKNCWRLKSSNFQDSWEWGSSNKQEITAFVCGSSRVLDWYAMCEGTRRGHGLWIGTNAPGYSA